MPLPESEPPLPELVPDPEFPLLEVLCPPLFDPLELVPLELPPLLDPLELVPELPPLELDPELATLEPELELGSAFEELPALFESVAWVVLFPNPLPVLARESAEGVNPARSENALSGFVNPYAVTPAAIHKTTITDIIIIIFREQ